MNSGTSSSAVRAGWLAGSAIIVLAIAVFVAIWLRDLPSVRDFIADYPGRTPLPADAPTGIPPWLGWQHFLNALFLLLIVRSGLAIRWNRRPSAYWTRRNTGVLRTRRAPHRISLTQWFHLSLAVIWVLNGLVFYLLLFTSGQWMRIVPLDWGVAPNAISVAIQYLSLDWPTEDGWTGYNSLQLLSYTVTVFVAAPLAVISGLRLSPAWPSGRRWQAIFPVRAARGIHLPVMLYFVAFTVVHVTLVLATGALRNLDHMYAARDGASWVGFGIFCASLVVMAVAWVVARPVVLRAIASWSGTVTRG